MGGAEGQAHHQDADAGDGGAQHHHADRLPDDHLHIGQRRDQHLLDEMDEAGEIDRRGGLQEGGVDDVHHQDAGQHEFQIVVAADLVRCGRPPQSRK